MEDLIENQIFHCNSTHVPAKATDEIICEQPANQTVFSIPISSEVESTKNLQTKFFVSDKVCFSQTKFHMTS